MILCPSCHSTELKGPVQYYREPGIEHDFSRLQCLACGIEFWTPLIMPPASYYEDAGGEYAEFHEDSSYKIRWWHKTFFEKFPRLRIKGKILDIGCADGRILKELQLQGWDVYGLDFDSKSVEIAKRRIGNDRVFSCSLEEFINNSVPHSFDLITFFEVLEHQTDPVHFMENVKKILKPDGMIAGSVPNTDRYIVDKRFSPDNPPHHFTMWRKQQLFNFFSRSGYSSLEIFNTRYEPILMDQFIRSIFLDRIMEEKRRNLGKKNCEVQKKSGYNLRDSFFKLVKQYIWAPIYKLLGIFEYPYLLITKKSISLYFQGVLSEISPKGKTKFS